MAISATAGKKDVQFLWEGKDKRGKTVRGAPPAQTSPALAVPVGATREWRRNRLKRFDPDSQMARAIRSSAVTPALPST